jgi:hypothetical protein
MSVEFLIFAIHGIVPGSLIGNVDHPQPVFARFNDFYAVFLSCVNYVALGGHRQTI